MIKHLLFCGACLCASLASAQDEAAFFESPTPVSASAATPRAIIPPGRPDWLAASETRKYGDPWAIVTAGPYPSAVECEQELSNEIKKATDNFINEFLGSAYAARFLNYSGDDLKARFGGTMNRYEETVTVSLGPHQQIHAQLQFPDEFLQELRQRWNGVRQASRITQVGLVVAVLLGMLTTAFGYLKADAISQGGRRTSLQFASAGAILVIVVAGVAAARYIHWL